MGYYSSGFGLSALASVCLFGSNVARQGTEEQRRKYLPGIASGDKIGCWALTEPSIGSDAVSIQTRCDRKEDHYVLTGSKTFITNAPIADSFIVLAREVGPDGKLVSGFQSGTAFILDRGMDGLRTGKPLHKMGHRSSPTGEIVLDQVKVPMNQVLGKPGMAFLGMKASLDVERAVFGGLGVGLMRFCLDTMVRYGAARKQFGVPILEHQMVQEKIAEVAAWTEMLVAYRDHVNHKLETGQSVNKEAAVLKFMGARWAFQAADHAIQTLGGYGYMEEYEVERCLRDAKLYDIGGGTTEIQRMIIAKQVIKEILNASNHAAS